MPLILVFQNRGGAFDSQMFEEQSSVGNRYPLSGDVSRSTLENRLEPTQDMDSQADFKTSSSNQTDGDESDDNTVAYNKFSKIDYAAYDEWYCDKLTNSACTKPEGECPSQNNWFKHNTTGEDRDGRAAQIFSIRGPDRHKLCRVNNKRRLRTAVNTRKI